MLNPAPYSDGTAVFTAGSTTVTGIGTAWSTRATRGSIIKRVSDGASMFVASDTRGRDAEPAGDLELELMAEWPGTTTADAQEGDDYILLVMRDSGSFAANFETLIERLIGKGLGVFVTGEPVAANYRENDIVVSSSGAIFQKQSGVMVPVASGFAFDAMAETLAERDQYDTEAPGFTVYRWNTGEWYINTDGAGTWAGPFTLGAKGDPGTAATISPGTVTNLEAGEDPTVTNSGTSSEAVFDFGIPRGATGPANSLSIGTVESGETAGATITGTAPDQTLDLTLPKGDTGPAWDQWQGAWVAGTYQPNDMVSHNGSSWIATAETTEEPGGSATDWDLAARAGQDGEGTGDITGATNLGSTTGREGIFASKSGANLQFKSLVEGTGVTLSSDANEITINASGGSVADYDTIADAEAATVPAARDTIRTGGFTTAGDGGGWLYKRVASDPSPTPGFQDASDAWFEAVGSDIPVTVFAATGTSNDAAAFNAGIAWINASSGRTLRIPASNFNVTSAFTRITASSFSIVGVPRSSSITVTSSAAASVNNLFPMGDAEGASSRGYYIGGFDVTWDNSPDLGFLFDMDNANEGLFEKIRVFNAPGVVRIGNAFNCSRNTFREILGTVDYPGGATAIDVRNSKSLRLDDLHLWGSGGGPGSCGVKLHSNDNIDGVYLHNCHIWADGIEYGLDCNFTGGQLVNVWVDGCVFDHTAERAIHIHAESGSHACRHFWINGTRATGNTGSACVHLRNQGTGPFMDIKIEGNTLGAEAGYAVLMHSDVGALSVQHNYIQDNDPETVKTAAIRLLGSGNTIVANNTIGNSSDGGMTFFQNGVSIAADVDGYLVTGNDLRNVNLTGVNADANSSASSNRRAYNNLGPETGPLVEDLATTSPLFEVTNTTPFRQVIFCDDHGGASTIQLNDVDLGVRFGMTIELPPGSKFDMHSATSDPGIRRITYY